MIVISYKKKMRKKIIMIIVILALIIIIALIIKKMIGSKIYSDEEFLQFFNDNEKVFEYTGNNLVLIDEYIRIEYKENNIIINTKDDMIKKQIQDNEELLCELEKLFDTGVINSVDIYNSTVTYYLNYLGSDYWGYFIYSPENEYFGSESMSNKINNEWTMEILPKI